MTLVRCDIANATPGPVAGVTILDSKAREMTELDKDTEITAAVPRHGLDPQHASEFKSQITGARRYHDPTTERLS